MVFFYIFGSKIYFSLHLEQRYSILSFFTQSNLQQRCCIPLPFLFMIHIISTGELHLQQVVGTDHYRGGFSGCSLGLPGPVWETPPPLIQTSTTPSAILLCQVSISSLVPPPSCFCPSSTPCPNPDPGIPYFLFSPMFSRRSWNKQGGSYGFCPNSSIFLCGNL